MQDSVHSRLKELLDHLGLKITQFSAQAGIPYRTVQDYLSGKNVPGGENLQKMNTVFRVSIDWLLTGRGPMVIESDRSEGWVAERRPLYSLSESANSEFCFIPQVRGEIGAGGGLVPDNTVELKVAFRRDWISRKGNPDGMSIIRVSGDSMEPTLLSGDLVLVDHGRNYMDPQGGIYALAIDNQIMIKRLQPVQTTGWIRIISDNPRYETYEADPEKVRVNGKVIWFGRELER